MDHMVTPAAAGLALRSAVGLGCVTFGREIDAAASFAMMDHAVARGIILFDTASAYGGGESERIVGQWLKARDRAGHLPQIATKALPPYTADAIKRSVDNSRARLAVDCLDVFFLHRWDDSLLQPEPYAALAELVAKGVVRQLGVSNIDDGQLAETLRGLATAGAPGLRWVQNIHNFAVRGFSPELKARCAAHGIRLMGYSPLGAGFLTGKHRHGVVEGSRFAVIPGHQKVYFTPESQRRLAELERVAALTRHPQIDLAMAWAAQQPGVDMILVGGRSAAQIDQALAAISADVGPGLTELARSDLK